MSAESPPAFLQAGSYGAEQTRRAITSMLTRGSTIGSVVGGLVGAGDCALSPPGSGMSVTVAPGELWIPGTTSATQGGYYGRVSSSTSLSIAAADPTNPRVDTVVAQVQDAAYAGSNNSFAPAVVTGSPASGATLANLIGVGSVPASSLVIGYVLVPANATNITSGDLATTIGYASFSPVLTGIQSGLSIIATSQGNPANTNWNTLSTPDEVTGLNITSAYGILRVWFQAQFTSDASGGSCWAAIFINSNQAVVQGFATSGASGHGPIRQAANLSTATSLSELYTYHGGLLCSESASAYGADSTTGQIFGFASTENSNAFGQLDGISNASAGNAMAYGHYDSNNTTFPATEGGPCDIFIPAAENITVSIKYYASAGGSGQINVENRKLFVQAISF